MRRVAAIVALALGLPVAARAQVQRGGRPSLANASRWGSFVDLVASRWAARVAVLGSSSRRNRQQASDCVVDAWYLALPTLLDARGSPCVRLIDVLRRPRGLSWQAEAERRAAWVARLRRVRRVPTYREYHSCVAEALWEGDSRLVVICARALEPRADLMESLTDADRFAGWLRSCKKVILGTDSPGALSSGALPGSVKPPRDAATGHCDRARDEEARHCLRTLPTLYEVQWLKKLSDYWTPAELRALRRRSEQLGREKPR